MTALTAPRISRSHWRLITSCFAGIGTSMVAYASLDGMLVPLQNDWDLSVDIISVLSLSVLAGSMLMLLPAGGLVDRWGFRRVLLIGAAAAIAGALLVMVAPSVLWFVAGRIMGGVGGMALAVASMALLNRSLTDDRERAYVFGMFAAVTATIFATSPVIASVISDQLSWRLVPLLWIAFAGAAVVLAPRSTSEPPIRGDILTPLIAGVVLSGLCLAALVVKKSALASAVLLIIVVIAAIAVLLRRRWLRDRGRPVGLDVSIFRTPGAPALLGVMMATALVNLVFYGNLLLQYRFGLTPTQATALLVIPQAAGIIGGLAGGWASARIGSLLVTAIACGLGCATSLSFHAMTDSSTALTLVLPLSLFGAATGCLTGSLTKAFLDCADPAMSGAAASWRQAGWSLGATFGGVVTSALVLGSFTNTWANALKAAGVSPETAQWVAESVRAGVPLANLSSSPALDGVVNREAVDSLVGLAAAQMQAFHFVGTLSALAYGIALACTLLAMWQQKMSAHTGP